MRLSSILLLASAWLISLQAASDTHYYVSTLGKDTWSGKLTAPNAAKTDGPFATITRARDAIRIERQQKPDAHYRVEIRGGRYRLSETIVFGQADGGGSNGSVTYAAYKNEMPILSGGRAVTAWQELNAPPSDLPAQARPNVWVAKVSDSFYTLYDEKGLLPRARATGFLPLDKGSKKTLHAPPGILKNWSNLQDVEIVIRPLHAWVVNILPIKSVSPATSVAKTTTNGSYPLHPQEYQKVGESCWIENTLEALDQPGEWVLDSNKNRLYLWPREKGAPEGIITPTLRELIRVEGKVDLDGKADAPVQNLTLEGLTFMHGESYRINKGDAGLQHDWDFFDKDNAMIRFRGTEDCTIRDCRLQYGGGGGIRVDLHGRRTKIIGNQLKHLGGAGILLAGYGPGTKDVNTENIVSNNHIQHTGEVYNHSPGIMIWQSGNNRIANNLIHHTPYAAIIVSGFMEHFFTRYGRELSPTVRWHEISNGSKKRKKPADPTPFLHSHDNVLEYNEIHHAMEKLGDGNAIYIRGAGPNNVIRRNYIHHLTAPTKMQAAIRTDGGQRDTLIAENVIYKCTSQGIKLKLNNRAENNFIVDVVPPMHKGKRVKSVYLALREGPMTEAVVKRNVFYHTGNTAIFYDQQRGVSRGRAPAPLKDVQADQNLYWLAGAGKAARMMLKGHKNQGVDQNSIASDPLFVNPEKGDFRFKPNSPALKLGIAPIDVSKCGLLK